jgi:hypothetical protein
MNTSEHDISGCGARKTIRYIKIGTDLSKSREKKVFNQNCTMGPLFRSGTDKYSRGENETTK